MHRQQPGGLVYGKPAVWSGADIKVGHSSVFFVEKENIARKSRARICQLLWMFTSANHLHMHPLRMQPRDGTEASEFPAFRPSTRRIPPCDKQSGKKSKKADGSVTLAHGAATTKRGRGLPEKRLRQSACRTLSTGKYSSERDVPQLTQKLRAYNRVRTPRNAFDGRNCTVGEFFPLLGSLTLWNAGRVCNPTPLLSTLWKSARLKPLIEKLTKGLFAFAPDQSIRMPYPASESCV